MWKYLFCLLIPISLLSCKDKKKSLSGDSAVAVNDLFEGYPTTKLPYTVYDTSINKLSDTTTISRQVFTQFIPDTLIVNNFPRQKNIVIRPIGKFETKAKEMYLLTHIRSGNRSGVFLSVFDKGKKYSSSLPLLFSDDDKNAVHSASIDSRLSIAKTREWKNENELLYNRVIYAYNNVGTFITVLTETNDQSHLSNKINNPLDTLPKKNKYSGDYVKGKKSFLFLRDGKNALTYLFYVRFENDDEEPCIGELKGEIVMRDENSAVFTENADPCVVDFVFSKSQVKVKEQGSCGNHRGIKCFFDDTYVKKKESKPKS